MDIIVLGGENNDNYELTDLTKLRIIETGNIVSNLGKKCTLHFSGGLNKKFNNTDISHAKICQNFFKNIMNDCDFKNITINLHENNNSTVEEAIHFGNYLKNVQENIIIITNDWHKERVEYLFSIVFDFYEINKYEVIGIESNTINKDLLQSEKLKIDQLKEKPYGIWKDWIINNYYDKYLILKKVKKNRGHGELIVDMRNDNNSHFFDKKKFKWIDFQNTFYEKYFSNEIPPFFIYFKDNVIGFIGCKTVQENINDIGIMFFKKYQNKGFGRKSLEKFLKLYNDEYSDCNKTIISKILKNNASSLKIFKYNDFKIEINKSTDEYHYLTYN
jgi:RimJ/RimL family protein N-acetyltransferase